MTLELKTLRVMLNLALIKSRFVLVTTSFSQKQTSFKLRINSSSRCDTSKTKLKIEAVHTVSTQIFAQKTCEVLKRMTLSSRRTILISRRTTSTTWHLGKMTWSSKRMIWSSNRMTWYSRKITWFLRTVIWSSRKLARSSRRNNLL